MIRVDWRRRRSAAVPWDGNCERDPFARDRLIPVEHKVGSRRGFRSKRKACIAGAQMTAAPDTDGRLSFLHRSPMDSLRLLNRADAMSVWVQAGCAADSSKGGFGIVFHVGGECVEAVGCERNSTSNRIELLATIKAIEAVPRASRISLHTSSQYICNGVSAWIDEWKRNGWNTRDGLPVRNADLWERLEQNVKGRSIDWRWINGRATDPAYIAVERLAALGRETLDG